MTTRPLTPSLASGPIRKLWVLGLLVPCVGCDASASIGSWPCSTADLANSPYRTDATGDQLEVGIPWRADFEEGFCPYTYHQGFCYVAGLADYTLVSSPTHSGNHAVAFRVGTEGVDGGSHVRCVRQGVLPKAASYSAWYYLPESGETTGNWNLLHFQGDRPGPDPNLWDVSLVNEPMDAGTELRLVVRDLVNDVNHPIPAPVPLRSWFQLRVDLRRAADESGTFAFYLNGVAMLRLTNLVTDDSTWGQWYVGNLASTINPPQSTLYVDDVEILPIP